MICSLYTSNRLFKHLTSLKARRSGNSGSVDDARILVFVLYKKEAVRVENTVQRRGYSVGAIHGDLNQGARIAALEDFKSGRVQILVATDVAARGLDIPNVGMVINYSFPLTVEDYIHRIGRTGASVCAFNEFVYLYFIMIQGEVARVESRSLSLLGRIMNALLLASWLVSCARVDSTQSR